MVKAGVISTIQLREEMKNIIASVPTSNPDYISIVESDTFKAVETLQKGKEYYFLIACKIGSTRLIDNFKITV